MSRVEENEKFVANVPESFSGSTDQVLMKEYAAILGALVDISKLLAIIADANVIYKPIRDPKDLFNAFPPKEVIDDVK